MASYRFFLFLGIISEHVNSPFYPEEEKKHWLHRLKDIEMAVTNIVTHVCPCRTEGIVTGNHNTDLSVLPFRDFNTDLSALPFGGF